MLERMDHMQRADQRRSFLSHRHVFLKQSKKNEQIGGRRTNISLETKKKKKQKYSKLRTESVYARRKPTMCRGQMRPISSSPAQRLAVAAQSGNLFGSKEAHGFETSKPSACPCSCPLSRPPARSCPAIEGSRYVLLNRRDRVTDSPEDRRALQVYTHHVQVTVQGH